MWKEAVVAQFEVGRLAAVSEENCPNLSEQSVSAPRYETGNFHLRIRSKAHCTAVIGTCLQTESLNAKRM